MAEHLENLVAEHLEWKGYVVRRNILVGKRAKGGWDMELDIVAYEPKRAEVLHVEPSLDADPWSRREERFRKKFEVGRRLIFTEVFPWIDPATVRFEQLAIVTRRGARTELAGGRLTTVDEYLALVRKDIEPLGAAARSAVPSKFPLLRIIQFVVNGYYRVAVPE
jgi:hypothetical protein